ncbi:MAG TPA: amidohydrolase family protein, partial [Chitinophagaceae bacterium]
SLVPHAPYSVSGTTFDRLNELTEGKIISIHNQEHPAEDVLYKTGGGDFLRLFAVFGMQRSPIPLTGASSLRSVLSHFNRGQTIFLVHNTYTPEEDIVWANDYAAREGLELYYCLCPNANLYIESRLPDVSLLLRHRCRIILGTDSYSSNWQLSIAKEIGALGDNLDLSQRGDLRKVLQWATLNGAEALRWDHELGSFAPGKQPGVALIDPGSWTSQKLA